jgi:hypothetical protein
MSPKVTQAVGWREAIVLELWTLPSHETQQVTASLIA